MPNSKEQLERRALAEAGREERHTLFQCRDLPAPDSLLLSRGIIPTCLRPKTSARVLTKAEARGCHKARDMQTSTSQRAQGWLCCHQTARRGAYLYLHSNKHRAQLFVQLFQHCESPQAQTAKPVRQRKRDTFSHHHPWGPATWYLVLRRQPGCVAQLQAQAWPHNIGIHRPPRQPIEEKRKEGKLTELKQA